MWPPIISVDGNNMSDPIADILYDSITKPYHDEKVALKSLLPSTKTIYVPNATSKIISKQIIWAKNRTDKALTVLTKDTREVNNSLQLLPSGITNTYICFRTNRVKDEKTDIITKLTGTWKTTIVGPLVGKSYEKEVPITIATMGRTFYTHTEDSQLMPHPIIDWDNYQHLGEPWQDTFDQIYGIVGGKLIDHTPVFTSMIQQVMKSVGLENLPWYSSQEFMGEYKPINWNPLTKNLADVFANLDWGDYIIEGPPPSGGIPYAETHLVDKMTEKEYNMQQEWAVAAANMRDVIDAWISDHGIDHYFELDHEGDMYVNKDWKEAFGKYVLFSSSRKHHSGSPIGPLREGPVWKMIEAVLKMEFSFGDNPDLISRIEEAGTYKYLLDNQSKVTAFLDTAIMCWIMALQLPSQIEDYVREEALEHFEQ